MHRRIRIERQEYPKKTVVEAINEKLDNESTFKII